MKLHLPKALLTAVMALFAVSQTAWAGWASDNRTGGYIYYYDQDNGLESTIDELVLPTADNGVSNAGSAEDKYTKLYLVAGAGGDNKPEGYDGQTTTIGKVVAASGITFTIAENPWQTWKGYKALTIEEFEFGGGTGSGVLNINNGTGNDSTDNVQINKVSGTLTGLTVAAGASLTLGDGTTAETFTLGGSTNISTQGTVTVAQKSTIRFTSTDAISHSTTNCGMTLDGSTWEANGTRQSLGGNYTLTLKSGVVQDSSTAGFGDGYGVLDATGAATIVSSGTSSISGGFRIRGGNVTVNVTDGVLSVDTFNRQSNNTNGGIIKQGEGTLKITTMATNRQNEGFYAGNTTLQAGTIEYAVDKISDESTLDGSYTGTISGTGNIAKSGTGTVTLANIRDLDGDITVSGGTLNVTALSATKTIDVNTTGGTLNIGSITVNATTHQLSVKEGSSDTSYYTTDGTESGKNDLQNGFMLTSGDFVLFNDYVWSGTVEGWSVSDDGTNTYLTSAGTVSTEYYITTGEVSVGASTGAENYIVQGGTMNLTDGSVDVEYTSGSIVLATAAGIKLTSADNLSNIVSNTTGTGTISIADSATLNQGTYAFAGTLDVAAGKQLNYGNAQGQAVAAADATVRLGDNSVLYVESHSSTLGVLDVQGNATLRAYDSSDATSPALTIGEVKIAAGKTLGTATNWEGMMVINKLNAEGTLNSAFNGSSPLVINAIEKSGAINNTDAAATMTLGADGSSVLNLGGNVTNAGTLNIKGQLAGTSTISGGTINLADTASVAGTITLASDVAISGTLGNTGSLILNGNVTIADVTSLKSSGAITYSDNSGQDGYLASAQYYVFESIDGGTATVAEGMKLNNTYDLTVGNNSVIISIDEANPSGTYFVNTTVNYGGENASSQLEDAATSAIQLNGGTLNINKDYSGAAPITASTNGGTINIAANTTLNNSSMSSDGGGKASIAGDNTAVYSMGVASMNGGANSANNETKLNVAIGEGWEGTVVFEEGSSFKDYNFNLNDYGVAGSTIQFNGTATGSYLGEASATYVADIELKGDGFSIENGFGGRTYTFTGAFKGDGTFNMNKAGLNGGLDFIFSGNMSKWTGELKQSDAANDSYSYTFNEKATNIANKVTAAAGTMVVNVDNSEAVTMAGDVTATGGTMKLSKLGDSKLTVNNIAANGGNVVLAGTGANAIEVGNMSIKAGNTVTGAADVTVTNTLTINSSNAISLDGALVLTGATVDLSGFTVDTTTAQDTYVYTLGTAAGGINPDDPGASISYTGLNVDGYTAELAAAAADPTTSTVMLLDGAATNNYLVLTLTKVDDPDTLTSLNVTGATSYADGVLTLTTDVADAAAAVFGEKLAASMTDEVWDAIVGTYDLADQIGVSFADANGNLLDFDGANNDGIAPIVTINGEGTTGDQVLKGAGTVVGNYTTAYIPEPTTTTLSLLALAALAVRRRRK